VGCDQGQAELIGWASGEPLHIAGDNTYERIGRG
jgi:hypothetical protein